MAWLDLQADVLAEFGSVSQTERQRSAYDAWSARRRAHEYARRRERRKLLDFQLRCLRAKERARIAGTGFARALEPDSVAAALALPRRTGTAGLKPTPGRVVAEIRRLRRERSRCA
jgi:hypothetical protein